MIPIRIQTSAPRATAEQYAGLVVAREFTTATGERFRKGHTLSAHDLDLWDAFPDEIYTVELEADDVHEDAAATEIAQMISGDGITVRNPVQSRVNLAASRKGLLRVQADLVHELNLLSGMSVFTLPDRLPVVRGKIVTGAKVTPVAVPRSVLEQAQRLLTESDQPAIQVKAFVPHRVGVVVSEDLSPKLRDRFEQGLRAKIAWYGSEITEFRYVDEVAEAVAEAIRDLEAQGATLILTAGGSMMNPFDASVSALPLVDAEVIRLGAPAHPGSMFWLAQGEHPILNVASCSMYSRSTVADLVLPWVMADEPVTNSDLAWLGYGGLLDRDMQWRFPAYDQDSTSEPD